MPLENSEPARIRGASAPFSLPPSGACPADAPPSPLRDAAGTSAFPLLVRLGGARVAVVGAGAVAERKIETLLSYGACIHVVSPKATDAVRAWADAGVLAWHERSYAPGDVAGARLVVGATGNRAVDEAVYAEACACGALVNIVDVPDLCTAIVPAVVRRGPLQIAVSTSGAAPSVARDIRRSLEERYPAYWATYVQLLGEVRDLVRARVPGTAEERRPLYEAALRTNLLERIAAGERPGAEEVYAETVLPLLGGGSPPIPSAKETCR